MPRLLITLLLALLIGASVAQEQPQQTSTPPADREGFVDMDDGARVFYQVWGEGQPMLLIHGYPLNGGLFRDNVGPLSEHYQVATVDLRGYGQSETPDNQGSIETYAGDVLAVMDELGFEQAIIGGMSMGGPIVFEMYRQAPDRFSGMILIDTLAAPASPPEAGLWNGVAEMVQAMDKGPVIDFLMPDMLTGETRMNRPELVEYMTGLMEAASLEAWVAGANALATRPDSRDLLSQIDVPTLILVGLEDSLYPFEIARSMQEQIPTAQLEILPGAAHAAILEEAGLANQVIRSWAQGIQ